MLRSLNNKVVQIESHYFGLTPYSEGLNLQQKFLAQVQNQIKLHDEVISIEHSSVELPLKYSYILGLEHPDVITLGLRSHSASLQDILTNPSQWTGDVFKVRRGGLATLHQPGQLVIYPVVHLKSNALTIREFIRLLLVTTQKTLKFYGVASEVDLCEKPGVYTANGKIAFCGLHVHHGVTQHGLSINIQNDIGVFKGLQSCGVKQPEIDSLKNQQLAITPEQFFRQWVGVLQNEHFQDVNLDCDRSVN